MLGMLSARWWGGADVVWFFVAVVGAAAVSRRPWLLMILAVLISFIAGGLRTMPWQDSQQRLEQKIGSQVRLQGRVRSDTVYNDRGQLQFDVDRLVVDGVSEKGIVRVTTFSLPALYRYDQVDVQGKLRSGFGTRVGAISFAEVQITGRSASWVEQARQTFSAGLYSVLPEEQASLALGILVGQRANITPESAENLRIVGLTHIVAVSGYNLTVLVRLVRRRLAWLSKFQSTLASASLVAVFLMVAGSAASINRAAWVVGLSLAVGYVGRQFRPLVLLGVSAAITAAINPHYVWFDLGWWLSFAAFFGVMILAPTLQARLYGERQPHFLIGVTIESLAATILTAPLIMWIFGRFSVVSLLSNTVVVPLIPLMMVASLLAGISYLFFGLGRITQPLVVIASVLLGGTLWLADFLATLPVAEVQVQIGWVTMLGLYAGILIVVYATQRKTPIPASYDLLD